MTTLQDRWATGELVGEATHACVVRVRPGLIVRDYAATTRLDNGDPIVPPQIWKGHNQDPWQGVWTPSGPWVTVPNIQNAKWTRGFDQKGSSSCTVVMDNIAFPAATGAGGLYHTIKRGYYSPMRGGTPDRPSPWDDTGWRDVLNGGYQIELWEGYGTGSDIVPLATPISQVIDGITMLSCRPSDAIERTWTGLIEDIDMDSHPDHITLTCRDFGILFTDQRLQDRNKALECVAPITFADRKQTLGVVKVGVAGQSSGLMSPPMDHSTDYWWTEITAERPGHFEDFAVAAFSQRLIEDDGRGRFFVPPISWDDQEAWVSIYVGTGGGVMDGTTAIPAGWLDLGLGSVNSTPYVSHILTVSTTLTNYSFAGHTFELPLGSKFRLTVSNLRQAVASDIVPYGPQVLGKYYAWIEDFYVEETGNNPKWPPFDPAVWGSYWNYMSGAATQSDPDRYPGVNADYWILVEDAADVIKMLTIWAGFKEWYIEPFGWSLFQPLRYGEDKFFVDAIDDILGQGNFVFYMDGPTADDRSIGIPHFEHQAALDPPRSDMTEVTDADLLEAAEAKWDLSTLPGVIRYRGNPTPDGATFEQELVQTFQGVYYPPWSSERTDGLGTPRTGGVLRHFLQTIGTGVVIGLDSNEQCVYACVLAAMQYALAMCTGKLQIPGYPYFALDEQVSVIDEGSGINSRMWLASIESDHQMGPNGKWVMTIGGSYIDIEDFEVLRNDYVQAYNAMVKAAAIPSPPPPPERVFVA